MSDASNDRELHPAEVAKLEAEARAAEAQVVKLEAEARKAISETRFIEENVEAASLSNDKTRRARNAELAKDEYHCVYRFTGSVTGASVAACIAKLTEWSRQEPGCDMEIVFTSPGGSIIDGFVLYDYVRSLSNQGHRITTGCLGMAASMAGILLQMGDHRWVGSEGWIMIHRAAFGASGKTFEVEDEVEWVKRVERRILDLFVQRTGGRLSAAKIKRNWDRKDWWLTSDEALELGLVDEVR